MTPSAPTSSYLALIGCAFFRHRVKMVLCFLLCLSAVVAGTLLSPRAYRSQGKLYVRLGRENAVLDPATTPGQAPVIAVPNTRDSELNSYLEILTSRAMLARVVEKLGPAVVRGLAAPPAPGDGSAADSQAAASDGTGLDAEEIALLAEGMAKKLEVEVVKKTNILVVTYECARADAAQAVVATLIDLFLIEYVRLSRTPGSDSFLADQVAQVQKHVAATEKELLALKNTTGLVAPEVQKQLLVTRIGRLEDELLQAETSLATVEAEVEELRKRVEKLPPRVITGQTRGMPNQALDTMKAQLQTLLARQGEATAKYPSNHPEVQSIRKQIEAARAMLDKEGGERVQVTEGPNRLYEDAELALLKQEPQVRALKTKVSLVRTQLQEQRKTLTEFNRNDIRYAELQRRLDLELSQQKKYTESRELSRIDKAMQAEQITTLKVVQPATLNPVQVKPRLTINLALGLVFSMVSSVGLVIVLESFNRTVKTPRQASRAASVPLLASVPRLRRPTSGSPEILDACREAWSQLTWPEKEDNGMAPGQQPTRIIGVVGTDPGVGATLLASGLAHVAVEALREPILLINGGWSDANWLLDLAANLSGPGFYDAIHGRAALDDVIRQTKVSGLFVMPAGQVQQHQVATAQAGQVTGLFTQLRQSFAQIVVDLPSDAPATLRQALAHDLDGIVLVVAEEQSTQEGSQQRLADWVVQGTHGLGVMLNRHRRLPPWLERLTREAA